jgi:hypothetical protein
VPSSFHIHQEWRSKAVDEVLISIGPHKASNTLAVFNPVTRTAIDRARFVNTRDGYRELMLMWRRQNPA